MAIRYKEIFHKIIVCFAIDGVRSAATGVPYLSHYSDTYYNVSISPIFFPGRLEGISVPVMKYTTTIGCVSLTECYINIG